LRSGSFSKVSGSTATAVAGPNVYAGVAGAFVRRLCEVGEGPAAGRRRPLEGHHAVLLVDRRMNPRVVMTVGGRDSFAAIEPYPNASSEYVVDEAFADAEVM
jgi:hypothetical protein